MTRFNSFQREGNVLFAFLTVVDHMMQELASIRDKLMPSVWWDVDR